MKAFERLVRALAHAGIAAAAAATLLSMVVIGYSVVMRYFLGHPTPWVDELVGYLLVAAVMLAAADALLHGEHISVDVLTERLAAPGKRRVALGGLVAVAVIAALLAWEGADMVAFSRMVDLRSNGYLATPMWIPQLAVPIGSGLLVAAAVVGFLAAWRGGAPVDRPEDGRPPDLGV